MIEKCHTFNCTPLIPQTVDLSHLTKVAGITTVDGVPEPRSVLIVRQNNSTPLARAVSGGDGTFEVVTTPYQDPVMVMAYDSIGSQIKTDTTYSLNDIVHPPENNGYRYICIQAGTTATTLPTAPWPTDQITSGAAIFEGRKIRQPYVHGPVSPAPLIPT